MSERTTEQQFYGSSIQNNPGEPVLSQSRDLLEQPLDFYEPDDLPATQPLVQANKQVDLASEQYTVIIIK